MDAMESTFAIIKPDAVRASNAEEILQLIEVAGFSILAKKQVLLTPQRAQEFYAEHVGKPFFPRLQAFMTSGPVWALVLAKVDGIKSWRALMGPTNTLAARESAPTSLRALYGTDGTQNACHGSDSSTSAAREIKFFFPSFVLEPLPDSTAAGALIQSQLQATLVKALTVLAKDKPTSDPLDSITWLADYLLAHNPNKPASVPPSALPLDAADLDDEAEFSAYIAAEEATRRAQGSAATTVQSAYKGRLERKKFDERKASAPMEQTLAMLKPDAVAAGSVDRMLARIHDAGFRILQQREYCLTEDQAQRFYAEHIGKPFFNTLKAFMTSGPIVALTLERVNAIKAWRNLMGPTNSNVARREKAKSLRALFGTDGTKNACHGSDSPESAARELAFHFGPGAAASPEAEDAAAEPAVEAEVREATPEEQEAAALKIQTAARGRQARARVNGIRAQRAEEEASAKEASAEVAESTSDTPAEEAMVTATANDLAASVNDEQEAAAVRIQAVVRGRQSRQKMHVSPASAADDADP